MTRLVEENMWRRDYTRHDVVLRLMFVLGMVETEDQRTQR
jgi:hypothetical protein